MAKVRTSSSGPIGVAPTSSQKLIYVAQKLGLSGIASMQGTSCNLFDTVNLGTNTNRQTLTFFDNPQGKTRTFSNFQSGILKAGEANSLEDISFIATVTSSNNYSDPTNAIEAMGTVNNSAFLNAQIKAALNLGMLNLKIANTITAKDFLGFEQHPGFNPRTTGVALAAHTDGLTGPSKIPLESPAVLPPNQAFAATYEIPPVGTVTPPVDKFISIIAVLGRFGSIYSAKVTL